MVDTSGDWIRLTNLASGDTREIGPLVDKDLARVEGGIGDFQITVPMDRSLDDWAAIQARIDVFHGATHLFRGYLYDTNHREKAADSDQPGQTVLEGEGIGKEFTDAEIADHIQGTEKTYTDTTLRDALLDYFGLLPDWSATVYEPDTNVVSQDEDIQSGDSTSDLSNIFSLPDTTPARITNGQLELLQTAWVVEGESLTSNTTTDSTYSGGEAALFSYLFTLNTNFTSNYTIPAGDWAVVLRVDGSSAGSDGFDIVVDGQTITSVPADGLAEGLYWTSFEGSNDFDVSNPYVDLEGTTDGGDEIPIDLIAFADLRYQDPGSWDTTVDSDGYLSDPPLYQPVTIPATEETTSLAMANASLDISMANTEGSQRIQLSTDGGSTWRPSDGTETNTTSVSVDANDSRQIQGRITLSPTDATRTTQTPTENFEGQTMDSWSITADLSDLSVVDELTLDGSDWENITTLLDYGGYKLVIHHNENSKEVTAFNRGNAQAERSADWRELDRDTGISGQRYGNSVIVEGAERSDGTRPRTKQTDSQAVSADGREIRPGDGKITDLSITTDAGARYQALAILDLAQERGKRRGTIIAAPTVVEPGFSYPVDFGSGTEYVHLDEWQLADETDLVFEPSEALGDAIAGNSRGVNDAIRR